MTDAELIAEAHIIYANWKLGPGETRDMIEQLVNALEAHQGQNITDRTDEAVEMCGKVFNSHWTKHGHVGNADDAAWAAFKRKYIAILRPTPPETAP